jgi:predicted RNA-binding Zn-ribbon protein involved in translation (DUF1610 family)
MDKDTNFEKNREHIAGTINTKISGLKCPICGKDELVMIGGYFANDIQDDLVNRKIGTKNIPTVPIACKNCGFIMEFAAGALGLLPEKNEK